MTSKLCLNKSQDVWYNVLIQDSEVRPSVQQVVQQLGPKDIQKGSIVESLKKGIMVLYCHKLQNLTNLKRCDGSLTQPQITNATV